MRVRNWKADISIQINVSSIHLSGASWKMTGVNLLIQDSYLENFKLFFSGSPTHFGNKSNYTPNLTYLNTFYTFTNYAGSSSLIHLKKAKAEFINTTFQNIRILPTQDASNNAIINASLNTNIIFLKSHIVNNSGSKILVSASNFSSVLMEDCTVENNIVIFTLFKSTHNGHIVVNRSSFGNNKILNSYGYSFEVSYNIIIHILDAIFYGNHFQILQAEFNISVNISNCQFIQNIIPCCVLANIHYYGSVIIDKCSFINNSVDTSLSLPIAVSYHGLLILMDSLFYNNSAIQAGVIQISNSFAQISNVSFEDNKAKIMGSCINLLEEAEVQVNNSIFYEHTGVAIVTKGRSNILFENCTFVNNSSPADSLIEIDNSKMKMTHCKIKHNAMGINGFVQSKKSSIAAQSCLFTNNSARFGSIFHLSQGSRLQIEDSTLHHNTAISGGCIFSTDSLVNVGNTLFHSNKAISCGGAVSCERSYTIFENTTFINHSSIWSAVLNIGEGTLVANSTIFRNNSPRSGPVITKTSPGGITLENCVFSVNTALWHFYFDNSILRLSNTNFTCKFPLSCLSFIVVRGAKLTTYTWKSNINFISMQISSTNPKFLANSMKNQLITTEGGPMYWNELPFASSKLS